MTGIAALALSRRGAAIAARLRDRLGADVLLPERFAAEVSGATAFAGAAGLRLALADAAARDHQDHDRQRRRANRVLT